MTQIHPSAIVDSAAKLADDVVIGPFCIVGPDVTLGARVRLLSHVVVDGVTTIGEDTEVHAFAQHGAGGDLRGRVDERHQRFSTTMAANSTWAASLSPTKAWPRNL